MLTNAEVRKDQEGYENVLGAHGTESRNEEGEDLLYVCVRNNIIIGNTLFQKKIDPQLC